MIQKQISGMQKSHCVLASNHLLCKYYFLFISSLPSKKKRNPIAVFPKKFEHFSKIRWLYIADYLRFWGLPVDWTDPRLFGNLTLALLWFIKCFLTRCHLCSLHLRMIWWSFTDQRFIGRSGASRRVKKQKGGGECTEINIDTPGEYKVTECVQTSDRGGLL